MLTISHEDIVKSGGFNIPQAIDVTQKALLAFEAERILYPDKVSQIFEESTQNRINCLPATLFDDKVCGMKWVAVFPTNPTLHGLPNLNATILLSEIETGYPIAIMDATLCSDLRTAAISAVAARYLAKENAQVIGYIGAGEQARMNFLAMMSVRPSIKTCKVASRTSASEQRFIEQMKQFYPQVEFVACNSVYEKAATESDIIVTAISAQLPLLQASWVKPGAFYSHVAGWEDAYDVPLSMDKIVCDSWESAKHRTQTISRLYKMGRLTDDDIYADLPEIVAGKKGREFDSEKIYFNSVGLSYVDVALGYQLYQQVKDNGLGYKMDLYQKSVFDINPNQVVL